MSAAGTERTKAATRPKARTPKAKSVATGKTVTIQQIGSPIRRPGDQRATLIGLGLNKMRRVSVLEDTPAVRGMIRKVGHLVKVIDE